MLDEFVLYLEAEERTHILLRCQWQTTAMMLLVIGSPKRDYKSGRV
jgi:hypothetical protein